MSRSRTPLMIHYPIPLIIYFLVSPAAHGILNYFIHRYRFKIYLLLISIYHNQNQIKPKRKGEKFSQKKKRKRKILRRRQVDVAVFRSQPLPHLIVFLLFASPEATGDPKNPTNPIPNLLLPRPARILRGNLAAGFEETAGFRGESRNPRKVFVHGHGAAAVAAVAVAAPAPPAAGARGGVHLLAAPLALPFPGVLVQGADHLRRAPAAAAAASAPAAGEAVLPACVRG